MGELRITGSRPYRTEPSSFARLRRADNEMKLKEATLLRFAGLQVAKAVTALVPGLPVTEFGLRGWCR